MSFVLKEIQKELNELEIKRDLVQAQRTVLAVIKLLDGSVSIDDAELYQVFTDSDGKIRANASWFYEDSVIADRKATYKVNALNDLNIDFKLYGVVRASKRVVSWITALTPNFEDEAFNSKFNVGIDFVVPKSLDRIIVVLTNNYIVRTLELKGELTATYQEILLKWASIKDFSNKREVHNILWDSFDLQPLNKKFYAGISQRFITLRQHLLNENILDSKHASMFANRLIGRVIFCWFLDKKSILNPEQKYFNATIYESGTDYYRKKLEVLFYSVLNTPIVERSDSDKITPFLNGGLFEARDSDLYNNSKLTFPKNYFDDLFEFLNGYNFTTDESTSQYQQVAIDPEMLGRIFENLLAEMTEETGEQARKAKGAFYTPREIVDYMCRESLKEYLKTKLPEDEFRDKRLEQLIDRPDKEFQDQDHNWRRDWKPYKEAIIKALDELKMLDPACGSGAFPMGMLQLLVRVYDRLESRFDSYKTKLQVIENNIYGVDIEPMAVEISRLRAWLSIIVDEESDSKKIKPLPNLEFKFVCANSLIDLDQSGTTKIGEDPELGGKLQTIRDAYFSTESLNKKKKLRIDYEKLVSSQQGLFGQSERIKQLKTYHPFNNESTAEFFNSEFMFGLKSFDILIGNPPYVSASKIDKKLKPLYKATYKSSYGSYDLYVLFIERSFKLLNSTGIYCYITSNKYFIADYAKVIRSLLLSATKIIKLIDLADCNRIFATALVSPAIIIGLNSADETNNEINVAVLSGDDAKDLNRIKFVKTRQPFSIHLADGSDSLLIKKIYEKTDHLGEIADVRTGVMGFDYWSLDEFINDGYIKGSIRIATNGFIDQYKYTWGEKARLYKKDIFNPYLNISDCKLNNNTKELFRKKKIIIRGVAQKLSAVMDDEGYGLLVAVHCAILKNENEYDPRYILAILNSKLLNWVHLKMFYSARIPEGSLKYPISFLKQIPIKNTTAENKRQIIGLVDEIMQHTDDFSKFHRIKLEIDDIVYKIYNLTADDILIISK